MDFQQLPPDNKTFFVHYQRQDFNDGDMITSLSVYANDHVNVYSGREGTSIENYKKIGSLLRQTEVTSVEKYKAKIDSLLKQGITLVHWNQNKPYFGVDHINSRYKTLTGKDLGLSYGDSINLSEWLINKFGDNYIEHPRLDNLAKKNNFSGVRETELTELEDPTFPSNRVLLLAKIYHHDYNETLEVNNIEPKIEASSIRKKNPSNVKDQLNEYFSFLTKQPLSERVMMTNSEFETFISHVVSWYEKDEIFEFECSTNVDRKILIYAIREYDKMINKSRSFSQNAIDLANFFVSINKNQWQKEVDKKYMQGCKPKRDNPYLNLINKATHKDTL